MEHPLYRPLREILQYANPNQQEVIAEAAEELNRLTAPLTAEIEEIQNRHAAVLEFAENLAGGPYTAHMPDPTSDVSVLLRALRASEARAAAAEEEASTVKSRLACLDAYTVADNAYELAYEDAAKIAETEIERWERNYTVHHDGGNDWSMDRCAARANVARDIAAAIRAKANGGKL